MQPYLMRALTIISLISSTIFALSGTGGTPLGGMGTGYVLYTGDKIHVSSRMPPAAANHALTHPAEPKNASSGFHFFVDGTAESPAKGSSEDARCPLQIVEFDKVGDISFHLDAFGPYWPGEGDEKYQLATSPLAFFDFTATNTGSADAAVAVAMQFGTGGKVDGTQAITLSSEYLMVDCDGTSPTFSAGGKGTFSSDGVLSNSDGDFVAAKCSVPAGASVHFKFVLGWYASYGQEGYYYENFYKNAKEAVEFGMSKFDEVSDGITGFVDRVMASNFPEWYKDRLLNNTYPLIHNSVCAKDGRVAFWEGCYGIIGTIDQGQHAAAFYSFNWPEIQWKELEYWIAQQRPSGQIHHDFNEGQQNFLPNSTANNRHLLPFSDKNHADYWWFPNSETWSDLNSMFLFKAYELAMATGDIERLKDCWDPILKAANRLIAMSDEANSNLPLKSHSTYDQKTNGTFGFTPTYCASVAVPSYKVVAEMAKMVDDNAATTKFQEKYEAAKAEFAQKYSSDSKFGLDGGLPNRVGFPEGDVAGYSWSNYLCLEPIMDKEWVSRVLKDMRQKQKGDKLANGEWLFYVVDHYGGTEIAINEPDAALVAHKQDYDFYYKQAPNQVHWQSLQKDAGNSHHDSYMTAPAVWHSYFQMCGYMIDNANQRLWIRPRVPSDLNGEIKDALLLNPKALGTLNYKETPDAEEITQEITVSYDSDVQIKELVLNNNTGIEVPFVYINDVVLPSASVKPEGSGHEKNIHITLDAPLTIGPKGISIKVGKIGTGIAALKAAALCTPTGILTNALIRGKQLSFSVGTSGLATIEVLSLNGAKIGTLFNGKVSSGVHSFSWNGRTLEGSTLANKAVLLRLVTPAGSAARQIIVMK